MRISRRNRFQSLVRVEMKTSVPMVSAPYPAIAQAAHPGASLAGQNASARNGAI